MVGRVVTRVLALAFALVGCAAPHRYVVSDVAPIDDALRRTAVLVDVIDARDGGRAIREPSAPERAALEQLRDAVRDHAVALGLIATPAVAAPDTEEQIDAILERAAHADAREVVFLREHEARVYLGSALVLFEIVVVDPRTRDILFERSSLGCRRDPALPFASGAGALHDALRRTVGDLFAALARSRAAGHRGRHAAALADRLLAAPLARIDHDRVVGPGWSFRRPPGWELAGGLASARAGVRSADGAFASIVLEPTPQSAGDYALGSLSVLGEAGAVIAHDVAAEGAEVRVETQLASGVRALQRITAIGGVGIVVTCAAPTAQLFEAHRRDCELVLESARFGL